MSGFVNVIMIGFSKIKKIITDSNCYYLHEFPWTVVSWFTEPIELKCLIFKSKVQTFDPKKIKYIFKTPKP